MKVRAHTCYLGKTGYAAHARSFFRELSKHVDLRVRNYTWCDTREYLNEIDLKVLDQITLTNQDGSRSDYWIKDHLRNYNWSCPTGDSWKQDVDIVLMETNHHYFYDTYNAKVKIAYTVWESTELPEHFFNQLLKFDYLWVVTEWHKRMVVKQGYPEHRVFVVNEGVDSVFFDNTIPIKVLDEYEDDRFKFLFFGRWDYRKAVPEVVKAFLTAFNKGENVDLVLSADNPFSIDGMNSTEERLSHYGFNDPRIKVKHFVSREDYIAYLKTGHVFVSCARSEGWNIPLIEAMAAGTPAIYSNWGAQLEFAEGKGIPVNVNEERPANRGVDLGFAGNCPGNYAEPDFADLHRAMNDAYWNYKDHKKKAFDDATKIAENFNWATVTEKAKAHLDNIFKELNVFKNGEAAVVMAHADTDQKKSILKQCITTLAKKGYTVIVSSHIEVDKDVLEIADFVIHDKDNPVVYSKDFAKYSNAFPHYYYYHPDYMIRYSFDFNHGYAAYKLMKSGLSIARAYDFKKVHFINYDYVITNDLTLKVHSDLLEKYGLVSYYWGEDQHSFNTGFFSAKADEVHKVFDRVKTIDDYFSISNSVILENVLHAAATKESVEMKLFTASELNKSNNRINQVILSTNSSVKIKSESDAVLFLAKDQSSEYYIVFINNQNSDYSIEVRNQTRLTKVERNGTSPRFVRISKPDLDQGITVKIDPHGEIRKFDLTSPIGECQISNYDLVQNLNTTVEPDKVVVSFTNGPLVEVKGRSGDKYRVEFIDSDTNSTVYTATIGSNGWARCNKVYYINWNIRVTNLTNGQVENYKFDLAGKRVLISIDSSSLGDSIAWFAHIDEFRKKHGCEILVSMFKPDLFEKAYPELKFVAPGSRVSGVFVHYRIGWYYKEDSTINLDMHPREVKTLPMQATTTDILGLPYTCMKPAMSIPMTTKPIDGKYICIGIHATALAKYWNNPTGWQEVVDHYLTRGYKVVNLSSEPDGFMGVKYPVGTIQLKPNRTLAETMSYLIHSDAFIGLGSGLSWLSWAMNVPTVVISGFSKPYSEMTDDSVIRIFNGSVCNGCFNSHRLDAGDWRWCPVNKGTDREFECTKSITSAQVINELDKFLETRKIEKSIDVIVDESYYLGMVQNHSEIIDAAKFVKELAIKNFMEIGTDQGGTFAIWSKVSKEDGIRISLDMPHGHFGRADYDVQKRDEYLKSLGKNVTMIHGDSHLAEIKEQIKSILDGTQLDFLFIDGDHTYDGVKMDYEMYKEFVKPGGWIGFHDIKETDFHTRANCRVDKLWSELEGEKVEFCDYSSHYGGIGFIKVV